VPGVLFLETNPEVTEAGCISCSPKPVTCHVFRPMSRQRAVRHKRTHLGFNGISAVFQRYFNGSATVFQRQCNGISAVVQRYFNGI
jgi:hypothetical protein